MSNSVQDSMGPPNRGEDCNVHTWSTMHVDASRALRMSPMHSRMGRSPANVMTVVLGAAAATLPHRWLLLHGRDTALFQPPAKHLRWILCIAGSFGLEVASRAHAHVGRQGSVGFWSASATGHRSSVNRRNVQAEMKEICAITYN